MDTNQQGYNGWTNYATWGVALVLDNDAGSQAMMLEMAEAAGSAYELAGALQDRVEEMCGLGGLYAPDVPSRVGETEMIGMDDGGYGLPMIARQVLQAGLADVNWDEIAGHYVEQIAEMA